MRRRRVAAIDPMLATLTGRVIGQEHAMREIVPWIRMHDSGLAPEGRPAGVFLLLGPTGTGKTRTVQALAEVLHGNPRNLLRIDCGEYQMDHEVAKLTGAPPGYLGHKETHPVLTQARLTACTSSTSSLSLVLFDEIEKASPALTRLLLGLLDTATLRLGDNNLVQFDRCLIFLTSNIGADRMQREIAPGVGFRLEKDQSDLAERMDSAALRAAKRFFAPEFMNRIDAAITYHPLNAETLRRIVDQQLADFQRLVHVRLGSRSFRVVPTDALRQQILEEGTSQEYGAREIKRAIHRLVAQRVAQMVVEGRTRPRGTIRLDVAEEDEERAA